jgi:hypothetical protein
MCLLLVAYAVRPHDNEKRELGLQVSCILQVSHASQETGN